MFRGKALECFLGLQSFIRGQACHVMDVPDTGEVINEDGSCTVSSTGESALELSNKADLSADHLVY